MKPMLPTLHADIPTGSDWIYETKYDGFRSILTITNTSIELMSRNEKSLNDNFPEIINEVKKLHKAFEPFLPITLDGELVYLETPHFSNFELLQIRGRLKNKEKILHEAEKHPCRFLAFDLLELKGNSLQSNTLKERKSELKNLFKALNLGTTVDTKTSNLFQYVPCTTDYSTLWQEMKLEDGEGIIAKQHKGKWEAGVRTKQWLKIKNYKRACFFITGYDKENGYFHVGVYAKNNIIQAGVFSHGISSQERDALLQIIRENKQSETANFIEIKPAIVVELQFLSLYKNQLREPSFFTFRFDYHVEDCTWDMLLLKTAPIHQEISITHPDKPLWETVDLKKETFLSYLVQISPYMLPFLQNRLLTVIRFPHGMFGEAFYQKNCPDYAPDFIQTKKHEDIDYIICNNLSTLIWLGNQLAFEYHIPFQTIDTSNPTEIVFDLDPPSKEYFHLAIKAALEMKKIFDQFQLTTFPKLSGNKGLQIHIPISKNSLTYEETRIFTGFIAEFLVTSFPDDFTIERMKKNRGNRLYVDYIQHAEGKTIIAPYSLRGKKEGAYIAAPLYWEEITPQLSVEQFTIEHVLNRVKNSGCPFKKYGESPQDDMLRSLIDQILS
ncbi:DNA ligase D [Metabacillus litoralis]|uniref:DNA ligase D n=1 Tax=Metabacillus TaxID=2675233 RepID=UPI001B97A089|nr:DNA ligase D [Metabacillus litoralis]MCM3408713.1 DNA ligase D [Metabacillus litoralis]UHA59625.1 DNA ligase D [Metabacillus litoralis]